MNTLFQGKTLTFDEAQVKLNDLLSGLKVTSIQNGVSDTNRLYFTIFSPEHDSIYEFYISTEKWSWEDASNNKIAVLKPDLDKHSMHPITTEIEKFIQNTLTIEKVELSKPSMKLKLYFSNGSILEAQENVMDEDGSHYQLLMFDSKLNKNYNLLIKDYLCVEQVD